jgi:hypothetical protein
MADIYGAQEQFDDAVDKVKALIDDLITAMSTGYSPKISYCYKGHHQIPVQFNAVTVDFDSTEPDEFGKASGNLILYMMKISIRVHTKYNGRYADGVIITQLLNSVDNYLNTHRDLSGAYDIIKVDGHKTGVAFPESATMGGELMVTVKTYIEHIQA